MGKRLLPKLLQMFLFSTLLLEFFAFPLCRVSWEKPRPHLVWTKDVEFVETSSEMKITRHLLSWKWQQSRNLSWGPFWEPKYCLCLFYDVWFYDFFKCLTPWILLRHENEEREKMERSDLSSFFWEIVYMSITCLWLCSDFQGLCAVCQE